MVHSNKRRPGVDSSPMQCVGSSKHLERDSRSRSSTSSPFIESLAAEMGNRNTRCASPALLKGVRIDFLSGFTKKLGSTLTKKDSETTCSGTTLSHSSSESADHERDRVKKLIGELDKELCFSKLFEDDHLLRADRNDRKSRRNGKEKNNNKKNEQPKLAEEKKRSPPKLKVMKLESTDRVVELPPEFLEPQKRERRQRHSVFCEV